MSESTNVHEMLLRGEISIEEYAALVAEDPDVVADRLARLLEEYKPDFLPTVAMKNAAKIIYSDLMKVAAEEENLHLRVDSEVKLAETLRKLARTIQELTENKKVQLDIEQLAALTNQKSPIEDLMQIVSICCPTCRKKVYDYLTEKVK